MFGDNCHEIDDGFIVNRFGKYQPNITFVDKKEMELNATGSLIIPLGFVMDNEATDSMNMDFDGDAEFMFGDFWQSRKGGACFRPKVQWKQRTSSSVLTGAALLTEAAGHIRRMQKR